MDYWAAAIRYKYCDEIAKAERIGDHEYAADLLARQEREIITSRTWPVDFVASCDKALSHDASSTRQEPQKS
ncbi:hypothetical protein [Sphingobium indicum]